MQPLSICSSASSYKISLKSDNRLMSYGQKSDFQDGGHRHLDFKKKISISGHETAIWFTICCSVPNQNRTIFLLRYGDFLIFKMAAVRHLGF